AIATEPSKVRVCRLTKVCVVNVVVERKVVVHPDEVRMVEHVEHLGSELETVAFLEPPVLYDREVDVVYSRNSDGASSKRPKLSGRGQRNGGGIREPKGIAGVKVRIDSGYEVWPQPRRRSRRKAGVVLTGDHVYRRAAEERHDRVQLPVSDHVSRKRTPTL